MTIKCELFKVMRMMTKKEKTRRNCLRRAVFEEWLGLLGGFENKKKMRA